MVQWLTRHTPNTGAGFECWSENWIPQNPVLRAHVTPQRILKIEDPESHNEDPVAAK